MTQEDALKLTLEALHKIAMGADAKRRIEMGEIPTNFVLAKGVQDRAMGLCEIEQLAIDTWEAVVSNVEPRLPGTTIFECSPSEEP